MTTLAIDLPGLPTLPPDLAIYLFYAVVGLLVLLRFDARRFGAAEHDDEEAPGLLRPWLWRTSWYGGALLLIAIAYSLYERPISVLHLTAGANRGGAILGGLLLGALGATLAVLYTYWRFGGLRLPPARRYPAAVLNAVGTAFIDEAIFRGIILGLAIEAGLTIGLTLLLQTILYALATHLGQRGQPVGLLVMVLAIGFIGGWATITTGGIGAAVIAHALTRLAFFVASGRVGPLRVRRESETIAEAAQEPPPEGMSVVKDRDAGFGGYH